METTNFTLRLPPDLARALDARAGQLSTSRHQLVLDLLQDAVEPSMLIAGRWQVYLSEPVDCTRCGQPLQLDDTWLGATVDGRLFGPVCGGCASGE